MSRLEEAFRKSAQQGEILSLLFKIRTHCISVQMGLDASDKIKTDQLQQDFNVVKNNLDIYQIKYYKYTNIELNLISLTKEHMQLFKSLMIATEQELLRQEQAGAIYLPSATKSLFTK